ncbi:MAG TPA: response regulator [Kamptonema sp.]|nr:response regulator [Kamptonema sp.]
MSQQIDELLNNAPCGFLSFNDDGLIVMINATLSELLGYDAYSLFGKKFEMILPIASRIFYQTHFFPLLKLHGKIEEIYFSLRAKQGNDLPILINAVRRKQEENFFNDCIILPIRQRIKYEDEILKAKKVAEAATFAQKQAELALRQQYERSILLREITQHIRQSLDLSSIFEISTKEIRQYIDADRVGIFKFYPESNFNEGAFVSESVVGEFDSAIAIKINDHCFGEQYAAFYQQGRIQVVDDINHAGLTECHKDILQRFQVQANLVVPLIEGEQLWGLLCIHQCSKPRHWQDSEIEFVQQIANQLAIAIQQANLFKQLQTELAERQRAESRLTETNAQLAISNEELARATRLKDQFLANMSHELRTPLNAILGMTEGLKDEVFGIVNEHQIKALQTIEHSGSHLLNLINDILDIAKIESGQIELDYSSVSINNLCQSSLAFIKQLALKKRIQLEIKVPLNLPNLLIDERRIRQVLINLLNNAVKFTPNGGRITLEVSRQWGDGEMGRWGDGGMGRWEDGEMGSFKSLPSPPVSQSPRNYLRIAIIDTGIGIAAENIKKLFQPFIQIDSALNRQYEGTGLGLSLVKRIVELHGGQVGLTSELGFGSCFTIDLPWTACAASSSDLESPIALNMEPDQPTQKASPLILLAEDNEANINTISSYLGAKGYRIVLAKNGLDAIALTKSENPDLILMDIQMPGMDGLEAIKQIRLDPNLVDIPIVALTALAMTGDRDRCLEAGASDYISKPVKLKQLVATIQELLFVH